MEYRLAPWGGCQAWSRGLEVDGVLGSVVQPSSPEGPMPSRFSCLGEPGMSLGGRVLLERVAGPAPSICFMVLDGPDVSLCASGSAWVLWERGKGPAPQPEAVPAPPQASACVGLR